jgi:hypothetical protein
VLGMLSARGTKVFRPLAVAAFAGSGLVAQYLFFVGAVAHRFMLPALALLALPVGHGILALATKREFRIAIAVALAVWIGWQAGIVRTLAMSEEALQRPFAEAALDLRRSGGSASCLVVSVRNYPQIAYGAGCDGMEAPASSALNELVRLNRSRFARVFLVSLTDVSVAGCVLVDTISTSEAPLAISAC